MTTTYWTVEANIGTEEQPAWFPMVPTDGRHYLFDAYEKAAAFWKSLPAARTDKPLLDYRIVQRFNEED